MLCGTFDVEERKRRVYKHKSGRPQGAVAICTFATFQCSAEYE